MSAHRAYVAVGANLGDPAANVGRALDLLGELGTVAARSSLYRTKPWGKEDQPWFVNAVALLETALEPPALLERLRALERRLGRVPGERWGPRIIDLDLLAYDDMESGDETLRLPHPHLSERAFVLVPLAEIDERYAALRDRLEARELAGVVRLR